MANNLIDSKMPFIHSIAVDFRRNVYNTNIPQQINKNKTAMKNLDNWIKSCKTKEQQFLADFGVKTFSEWEQIYLIHTANNKKAQSVYEAVMKSINSAKTRDTLLKVQTNPELLINKLQKDPQINKTTLNSIRKALTNGSSIEKAIGTYIVGKGKQTGAGQKGRFEKLSNALTNNELKAEWERTLRGSQSEYLKQIQRIAKLTATDWNETIFRARKQLEDDLWLFYNNKKTKENKEIVKYYCDEWERALRAELNQGAEKRLLSLSSSGIAGELQEVGDFIVFEARIAEIQNAQNKNTIASVTREAQTKVQRFERKVESKTDIYFTNMKGTKYRFQEKNSFSQIYADFENSTYANAEQNIFGGLNLQGKIAYDTLLSYFKEIKGSELSGNFTDEDGDILSYLIANVAILNQFGHLAKDIYEKQSGDKRNNYNKFYKANTEALSDAEFQADHFIVNMVDRILSQNIALYISNVTQEDNKTVLEPYDFIIFKSRKIIPISAILECIKASIEEENNKLFSIHATYYFDSGMGRLYRNMIMEKRKLGPPENGWYTEPAFLEIGKEVGKRAVNSLYINKIRLNLRYKQTFNNKSNNIIGRIR